MTDPMELLLPPQPEFVGTARIFAAAIGRHFGVDEEVVADLKVAISEACTGAMWAHNQEGIADPVVIRIFPDRPALNVEVESKVGQAPEEGVEWEPVTPADLFHPLLGGGLIRTLFPDAEFIENGGLTVRFSVPL